MDTPEVPVAPPPPPDTKPTSSKRWWLVAGGLALLVAGLVVPKKRVHIEGYELTASRANVGTADSCIGRDRCVLVYIAPWCPACKYSLEAIKTLRDTWRGKDDRGISVVIGGDRPEKLEDFASTIGSNTFVDPDGTVHEKLGVEGVPYWVVLDGSLNVTKRFAGGLNNAEALANHLGVPL